MEKKNKKKKNIKLIIVGIFIMLVGAILEIVNFRNAHVYGTISPFLQWGGIILILAGGLTVRTGLGIYD